MDSTRPVFVCPRPDENLAESQIDLKEPNLADWISLDVRNAWIQDAWIKRCSGGESMTVDIKLQVRFTAEEANLRNKLDLESLKEFCVNRLTVEGAMGKYEIEDMDGRSIFATSAYERYRV